MQYWRTDFNWTKQQRWLNTHFHNFKMEVLYEFSPHWARLTAPCLMNTAGI